MAAQLRIDNFKFGPEKLTVSQGNRGDLDQPGRYSSQHPFDRSRGTFQVLDTDSAFTYKFEKAGTFPYVCGLHPFMQARSW